MHHRYRSFVPLLLLGYAAWPSQCPAEMPGYTVMEEVVSSARGDGRFIGAPGTATAVFTAEDIERMGVRSLPDLLETAASVRAVERGTPGSQADLSIRGSSAEGVLVLVDGIPVRDPQTGHFLIDLPVRLSGVERVEVLTGGGSALYGASATGGIVNIVTREQSGGGVTMSGGSFGTMQGDGSISVGEAGRSAVFGASWSRSDGYRRDNDLRTASVDGSGRWSTDRWMVRWNGGIMRKEFGARDFYSPYPSYERVMGVQAGITALRAVGARSILRLRAGGRGHADDFVLIRDNPSYYRNTHYNRGFLAGMEYTSEGSPFGSITIGTEAERIGIVSGKLGRRSDSSFALYGDCTRPIGTGSCGVTLRYDRGYHSEHILSPGMGIVFPFWGVYRLKARVERSFRSPTYTERFYDDPANHGNPGLRSERSVSAETGIERTIPGGSVGVGVFGVRTNDVIDWVRYPGEKVWSAANHGRIITGGVECGLAGYLSRGWRMVLSGTALTKTVRGRAGTESKYALNDAERTVAATLSGPIGAGVRCTAVVRFERMRSGGERAPVTLRCSRKIGGVTAGVLLDNIGNERYEEIPGLPAPGRWFTVELEYVR